MEKNAKWTILGTIVKKIFVIIENTIIARYVKKNIGTIKNAIVGAIVSGVVGIILDNFLGRFFRNNKEKSERAIEGKNDATIEGNNDTAIEGKSEENNGKKIHVKLEIHNDETIKEGIGLKDDDKQEGIKIDSLLIIFIFLGIPLLLALIFYHLENVEKRQLQADMKERIGVMQKEVERLRNDSTRLDSLLKEKELHIKLDVQGIPQRKGGGITVNNVQ